MPTERKGQSEEEKAYLRDVAFTGHFKQDFKREKRGRHRTTVAADLQAVIDDLANDIPLPERMVDHALAGKWKDHRDCHVKPDLILIYRKIDLTRTKPPKAPEKPKLYLVRLGSHSELSI